jgi:PAS domain S-box-containing protein
MFNSIFDYKVIFDLMNELIFILDDNLNITENNKAASEKLNSDSDSIKSKSIKNLLKGDFWDSFKPASDSNGELESSDVLFTLSNGKQIATEVHAIKIDSGESRWSILVIKDITDEKNEKLELLRFSKAIHFAANPIQITDVEGKMVYVNPAFERSSGYTKEELLGQNPKIISSNKLPKEFWGKVWNKILSGKVWSGQIENRRKNGTPIYTNSIISPILNSEGSIEGFLSVHNDFYDNKLLEHDLACLQRLGSIGALAAGIAHEIGNPLTSISSIAQLLQRTANDESTIEKLNQIKNQINRISNIIRQLVDFSRPTIKENQNIEINSVLKSAINVVKMGKDENEIEFLTELTPDNPKINLAADQLMLVFINLLQNAADAIGNKSGHILIKTLKFNEHLEIIINDSGIGIPHDNFDKIFEPFFSTKQMSKRIGLGLWVSYGIIRNLGGDILVESETGKGSTFNILLPIRNN